LPLPELTEISIEPSSDGILHEFEIVVHVEVVVVSCHDCQVAETAETHKYHIWVPRRVTVYSLQVFDNGSDQIDRGDDGDLNYYLERRLE
jgi:hypothetical protein